ncbi:protein-tyrosine sulfotransferase [Trichonephila clavata]|uniref:Protein-tyrosine sulfotransferase n=1 Tax=Trichonephila clavata TaxID=2740835 RepID=A0A8X6G969_TRICU|nr:protein-tyrosine sulfotransferase [Trichonephila clavata]
MTIGMCSDPTDPRTRAFEIEKSVFKIPPMHQPTFARNFSMHPDLWIQSIPSKRYDKLRFTLFRSNSRIWVWRLPREPLLLKCVMPTMKFGGCGIMLRRCFTCLGLLASIPGKLNAKIYCTIQEDHRHPMLWQLYGVDRCCFQ